MGEQQYFASNEKDEAEFNRLRLVEECCDPNTTRHLKMLRVSEGWDCLEVGAGAGSIAKWLSRRVGPTGKVVATDLDTRFIRHLSVPNLEIRQHDIMKDDLERDRYDLVHCRFLLMHLPEAEKALKRMANAIRPGGWLLIEEMDYGSILSIDITNPSAALYTAMLRYLWNLLRTSNILDPYFGRRVRSLVEQLELIDVGQDGWIRVNRGGDPFSRLQSMTLQAGAKAWIASGLFTQEQYQSCQRMISDPDFYCPGGTIFDAWGRRPVRSLEFR